MTPHPNAAALHALIDGHEVQWRDKRHAPNAWFTVTFADVGNLTWVFDPDFYEWRLKPKTMRYRVAHCSDGQGFEWLSFVTDNASAEIFAARHDFVRWAGDWQEVMNG